MRACACALSLLCVTSCVAPAPPHVQPVEVSLGRFVMGTVLEMSAYGSDPERNRLALRHAYQQIRQLDAQLSRHLAESDISRLNRAEGTPLGVAMPVREALEISLREGLRSGGAFDVTVGPLVALWTRAAGEDRLPDESEILQARRHVGAEHVQLMSDGRVALDPGTSVDLGGIAKGFALDRVLPGLLASGVEAALLSFGQSSTWAVGAPPGTVGWRLLVRAPQGGFAGIVTLRDRALSTSGTLGQWSEIAGRRFGHVLDPRSGWPLTRRRQALVVAPDATLAEVLSTALLILGEDEGIALVEARAGCEGLLLDAQAGAWETSGFREVTSFESLPDVAPVDLDTARGLSAPGEGPGGAAAPQSAKSISRSCRSRRNGASASRCESRGASRGHGIASSGSFQTSVSSHSGR